VIVQQYLIGAHLIEQCEMSLSATLPVQQPERSQRACYCGQGRTHYIPDRQNRRCRPGSTPDLKGLMG
jgi:hypothetical protein